MNKKIIRFRNGITIRQFAQEGSLNLSDVIKVQELLQISDVLDFDAATLLASEFNCILLSSIDDLFNYPLQDKKIPIITIMGHVDHGKTTLKNNIIKEFRTIEAGGITQDISFYEIEYNGYKFILVDTPGHAAFNSVRQFIAKISDLIILVVAANTGPQEQTKEIIKLIENKAKILCLTKTDMKKDNYDYLYSSLANMNILVDQYGGDILTSFTNMKDNSGVIHLMESIILQTELMELKTSRNTAGVGYVADAVSKRGLGCVVRVILMAGTIKVGQKFFSEGQVSTIKQILYHDKSVDEAHVGQIVDIVGFEISPKMGNVFLIMKNDKIADYLLQKYPDVFPKPAVTYNSEKKFIVKVQKATYLDTILEILLSRGQVLDFGVGAISERDFETDENIILIYWGKKNNQLDKLLKKYNRNVIASEVIYHIIDEIDKKNEKTIKIEETGTASVKKIFDMKIKGKPLRVVGCRVTSGLIKIGSLCYVKRNNEILYEGKINSLKREKESLEEAKNGSECGMIIDRVKSDINNSQSSDFLVEAGDQIMTFEKTFEN